MLPDAGFPHGVQDTSPPGDEVSVMGDCLPNVTYMSTKQFQHLGCDAG